MCPPPPSRRPRPRAWNSRWRRSSRRPPVNGQVNAGVKVDGAQVHARFLALKDYIQSAYKVKNYQVVGPPWLGSERFEIDAKLPAGATREQVPEMLQSLLADRFELKIHRETKDFPVYGLVVAKGGLKMEEMPDRPGRPSEGQRRCRRHRPDPGGTSVNLGNGSSFAIGANNTISGVKLTTQMFADLLARFTDRPVVDMTDLKGGFTFTLHLHAGGISRHDDPRRDRRGHAAAARGAPPARWRFRRFAVLLSAAPGAEAGESQGAARDVWWSITF